MSHGSTAAAGSGAAVAHSIANAVKASGAIVKVEPGDFSAILDKADAPLVVHTQGGVLSPRNQYLCGYKGLVFYTKSKEPLRLPPDVEIVQAKKIWIPG